MIDWGDPFAEQLKAMNAKAEPDTTTTTKRRKNPGF
jgi:hypothetical protein